MKQIGVALVLGLVGAIIVVILLQWFDPVQTQLRNTEAELARQQAIALAPLWLSVKRAWAVSLGVTGVSTALLAAAIALVAVGSVPAGLRSTWLRSWLIRPGRDGVMYPALAEPDGHGHIRIIPPVNEIGAQKVAALTTGLKPDVRLQGSAVRQILRQDDPQAMLEAPEQIDVEPAQQALTIDPVEKPHWLVVGQTGSGKSTATRYIMAQLASHYRVEFVICEPGGIDWNNAASAHSRDGIAEAISAVYQEFERRQTNLRDADVAHISQLTGDRMPYVYLVVEELEAVLDDLKITNKGVYQETLINLRQIARMGRKPGIGLIAVTQAARTDVFDSHVRTNLANVLLFRNGQGTAEMFRVGDRVNLPALPTGEAYSLAHGHRLAFPLTPRPTVPLSKLYREAAPLQLPADAESDGLGPDDMPDGPAVDRQLVQPLQPGAPTTGHKSYSTTVATVARPVVTLPKRRPTPVEAAAMRAHYARTRSKTATCTRFYGYKDGPTWDWVECAIKGEI